MAVAAVIGITLMSRYVAYNHPNGALFGMVVIALISALLIAGPVAIGLSLRVDIDKEGRAREEERQRFAAHLHDSVLQTLALIQRQASDPEAVAKLARRQEHALRAWMAGETDLSSATVAGAVRDMVADVEDEQGIKVEMTAIGDARLDDRSEELIAAGARGVAQRGTPCAGRPRQRVPQHQRARHRAVRARQRTRLRVRGRAGGAPWSARRRDRAHEPDRRNRDRRIDTWRGH